MIYSIKEQIGTSLGEDEMLELQSLVQNNDWKVDIICYRTSGKKVEGIAVWNIRIDFGKRKGFVEEQNKDFLKCLTGVKKLLKKTLNATKGF